MRYWWVNQNQTFRHEIEGGYLWSPKRNKNGRVVPVASGQVVTDSKVTALALAR